jgi:hypothetical protein
MATADEYAAARDEIDALRVQNVQLREVIAELGRVLEGLAEGTTAALADVQRIFDRLPE